MARRFAGHAGWPEEDPFAPRIHPERMDEPFHWRRPRTIFVSPLGDLFHEHFSPAFIRSVWHVMAECSRPRRVRYAQTKVNVYGPHRFFVLSKRPERMQMILSDPLLRSELEAAGYPYPLPNVMVMTTVENQEMAELRLPHLLATPAALYGVSCEPLLGALALSPWMRHWDEGVLPTITAKEFCKPALDWVVVGGENGPGARPSHPKWAGDLYKQCRDTGTPFFFKSQGLWVPDYYGPEGERWLKITGQKKGKEIIIHSDEASGGTANPVNMHRRHRGEKDEIDSKFRQFPEWPELEGAHS